jgi:hypothetical protein
LKNYELGITNYEMTGDSSEVDLRVYYLPSFRNS